MGFPFIDPGGAVGALGAPGVVTEMPVFLPQSPWQPSLAGIGRRLASRRELLRDNFRVPDHPSTIREAPLQRLARACLDRVV